MSWDIWKFNVTVAPRATWTREKSTRLFSGTGCLPAAAAPAHACTGVYKRKNTCSDEHTHKYAVALPTYCARAHTHARALTLAKEVSWNKTQLKIVIYYIYMQPCSPNSLQQCPYVSRKLRKNARPNLKKTPFPTVGSPLTLYSTQGMILWSHHP